MPEFVEAADVNVDTTICPGDVFSFAGREFTEAVTDQLLTLPLPAAATTSSASSAD